ncbi:hypothetical protein DFH06DRAFT_1310801 [Mycena polygramma]|nr:hypothetical protein DFH06DRAFT_1310801 [Mycena polygramma]
MGAAITDRTELAVQGIHRSSLARSGAALIYAGWQRQRATSGFSPASPPTVHRHPRIHALRLPAREIAIPAQTHPPSCRSPYCTRTRTYVLLPASKVDVPHPPCHASSRWMWASQRLLPSTHLPSPASSSAPRALAFCRGSSHSLALAVPDRSASHRRSSLPDWARLFAASSLRSAYHHNRRVVPLPALAVAVQLPSPTTRSSFKRPRPCPPHHTAYDRILSRAAFLPTTPATEAAGQEAKGGRGKTRVVAEVVGHRRWRGRERVGAARTEGEVRWRRGTSVTAVCRATCHAPPARAQLHAGGRTSGEQEEGEGEGEGRAARSLRGEERREEGKTLRRTYEHSMSANAGPNGGRGRGETQSAAACRTPVPASRAALNTAQRSRTASLRSTYGHQYQRALRQYQCAAGLWGQELAHVLPAPLALENGVSLRSSCGRRYQRELSPRWKGDTGVEVPPFASSFPFLAQEQRTNTTCARRDRSLDGGGSSLRGQEREWRWWWAWQSGCTGMRGRRYLHEASAGWMTGPLTNALSVCPYGGYIHVSTHYSPTPRTRARKIQVPSPSSTRALAASHASVVGRPVLSAAGCRGVGSKGSAATNLGDVLAVRQRKERVTQSPSNCVSPGSFDERLLAADIPPPPAPSPARRAPRRQPRPRRCTGVQAGGGGGGGVPLPRGRPIQCDGARSDTIGYDGDVPNGASSAALLGAVAVVGGEDGIQIATRLRGMRTSCRRGVAPPCELRGAAQAPLRLTSPGSLSPSPRQRGRDWDDNGDGSGRGIDVGVLVINDAGQIPADVGTGPTGLRVAVPYNGLSSLSSALVSDTFMVIL